MSVRVKLQHHVLNVEKLVPNLKSVNLPYKSVNSLGAPDAIELLKQSRCESKLDRRSWEPHVSCPEHSKGKRYIICISIR